MELESIYEAIITSKRLITKEARIKYVDRIAAQWRNPEAKVDTLLIRVLPIPY